MKTFLSREAWDQNKNFEYLNPNPTSLTLIFSHWNRKKSFSRNYYRRTNLIFYWLEIDKIDIANPILTIIGFEVVLILIHLGYGFSETLKNWNYFRIRTFENLKSTNEGFCSFDKLINVFGRF